MRWPCKRPQQRGRPFCRSLLLHLILLVLLAVPADQAVAPRSPLAPGPLEVAERNHSDNAAAARDGGPHILPFDAVNRKNDDYILFTGNTVPARRVSRQSAALSRPSPPPALYEKNVQKPPLVAKKHKADSKLRPPVFGDRTIPAAPPVQLLAQAGTIRKTHLAGDALSHSVPLSSTALELRRQEDIFRAELRADIQDGVLDMPLARFLVTAEYFHLARALLPLGRQPAFTMQDALNAYHARLDRIRQGLGEQPDAYAVFLILQRYAANKYYPREGSGMLLDSLFHNLNDCESGTKEILAYLDGIYPALVLGVNHGIMRTTSDSFIGHMQVYIHPGRESDKILANDRGLVLETTRVGYRSLLPYTAGDIMPVENFVARYYPDLVRGTLLEKKLPRPGAAAGVAGKEVGVSGHPLKIGYHPSSALLSSHYYDLAAIRSVEIANDFLHSSIAACTPDVQLTRIGQDNIFANFLAVHPSLRKNLVSHYLARLSYYDNMVMPQWRMPRLIVTYDHLAATLLEAEKIDNMLIDGAAGTGVDLSLFSSHRDFLRALRLPEKKWQPSPEKEAVRCREYALLDDRIMSFLFTVSDGPGLFFLPRPDDEMDWDGFIRAVADNCLVMPSDRTTGSIARGFSRRDGAGGLSPRQLLVSQAGDRSLLVRAEGQQQFLPQRMASIKKLFTGGAAAAEQQLLLTRPSAAGSAEVASVAETVRMKGTTGLNHGLIEDIHDFLGPDQMRKLFLAYAERTDLAVTPARALAMVHFLDDLLTEPAIPPEQKSRFLEQLAHKTIHPDIGFAARYLHGTMNKGNTPKNAAVMALQKTTSASPAVLPALTGYGLTRKQAAELLDAEAKKRVARLPRTGKAPNAADRHTADLLHLIALFQAMEQLQHRQGMVFIRQELRRHLLRLLTDTPRGKNSAAHPRHGMVANVLYTLALLAGDQPSDNKNIPALSLFGAFIEYAAAWPEAQLLAALLYRLMPAAELRTALAATIAASGEKTAALRHTPAASIAHMAERLTATATVVAHLFFSAPAATVSDLSGIPTETLKKNGKKKALWFLSSFHRNLAGIFFSRRGELDAARLVRDFYAGETVRDSFGFLAFLHDAAPSTSRVRFRKVIDLRDLPASPAKMTPGSRVVTRQDMSNLTLALNPGNTPQAISSAWRDTLAVTDSLLAAPHRLGPAEKNYLFFPHAPYLTADDKGFLYPPETIEEINRAASWAGRLDILLGNYLHFKNLPSHLPDWLLTAAFTRLRHEQKTMADFQQQSFLPMILQCEEDYEQMDQGLFQAKWGIRKPYGEDAFPATLLLLRMGHLDIDADGTLVETGKAAVTK